MENKDYDVVVVGAGHNGLTCAGYLAAAGHSVKVVERRHVVGGAAVTEEIHPGFRCSTASFVVGMLEPKVIEDLELRKYGFEIISRSAGAFLPQIDGPGFLMPRTVEASVEAIRELSQHDGERYAAFDAELMKVADVVKQMVLETPPNLGGGIRDVLRALTVGNRLRKLDNETTQALINQFTMSIGHYLDNWFESDLLKGMLAFPALTGVFTGPYATGTAYGLLHHAWGMTSGTQGKWDYTRGGMGGITQAMARSAEARGVDIQLNAGVQEVIVEKGVARGVVLEDGSTIRARAVVSNLNPKLLFTRLVDPKYQPAAFHRRMQTWRCGSGSFRMNVALSELPDFLCRPGTFQQDHHTCSMFICPSLQYCEDAHLSATRDGWSAKPIINMSIPSTVDDSLAPAGAHVATLFCQHFDPNLPNGKSWDDVKEEVADHVIDTVNSYAPNFKQSVIARQILTPLDLEREFSLPGGDIFHGSQHLDQIYGLRPAAGYADYRTPVKNLYMCGAGTHPGGGVSGAPGHNAAHEMIRDFKSRKLA